MKPIPRLLVLAGMLSLSLNMLSQDTNRFVFLCFGQSNREGFPGIEEQDNGPVDERFRVLAAVDFPKLRRTKDNWTIGSVEIILERQPPFSYFQAALPDFL